MIKSIEKSSVHQISSGQVLVDLQTAVKELVENSLDAGATTIDVKFKDYGLTSFEVNDNGSGIAQEDYDNVAMKHYTSKLSTFEDLTTVQTFGFRGEALSSLCALSERVTVTTATAKDAPMGTVLEFDKNGVVKNRSGKAARQRGTSVHVEGLFVPLPVRRKELERNSKREFGKALTLLSAYALVPCTKENKGVRLSVVHILDKGRKSDQIRTDGKPSLKASISSLWGPKQVDSLTELNLDLEIIPEKTVLRRQADLGNDGSATKIQVRGFISKFSPGCGRAGPDRQFFFINGRPCNPSKIQKAFNEVYRSFNANQTPFIVADFIVPTNSYDVNVSPDKRTILLHSENTLVAALKEALEKTFAPTRSTFAVQSTQSKISSSAVAVAKASNGNSERPDASASNSQEALSDLCIFDDVDKHDVNVDEASEGFPITQRPPAPSLAVPTTLLESEEPQAPSYEVPTEVMLEDVPQASSSSSGRSRTPLPHTSDDATSIPFIQPRRRSPSPLPASHRIPSPALAKPSSRPIQMVLDTTNASWSMRPTTEEPAPKRRKLDELKNTNPRAALRSQLLSFASTSSQLARNHDSEESDVGPVENADDTEEENGTKEDVEEDELMEEELEEMRMDAQAGIDNVPTANAKSVRLSVTNNNKVYAAEAVIKDPSFIPDLEELELPPPSGKAKEDPIELDLDEGDDGTSLRTACSNGHEESKAVTSIKTADTILEDVSPSDPSETTAQTRSGVSVEIVRTADPSDDAVIQFSPQDIDFVWNALSTHQPSDSSPGTESPPKCNVRPVDPSAGLSNTSDEESAERELARVINKEDFASMEIIGQFNLGFIIAKRRLRGRKPTSSYSDEHEQSGVITDAELDDLFIIDQHAADEKYNFETLQQTTKIDSQKLYQPRPLELTAADELLALENIDVLKNNGFEISVDDSAEPSQGRIKLVAQPVSGSTDFDMKDLEELLHLMQDKPAGQKMVRCSKARAMFASRACRKSVMIGMALNRSQMTAIVRHMGTMDQPWNCPHGRPTMRHLTGLNDAAIGARPSTGPCSRNINWVDL